MAQLCGKGIWLAHSYDLQRAAEMATSVGGTHLFVKVGHGPFYFTETTHYMLERVRTLGFAALAWVYLTARKPEDTLKAIVAALSQGYEACVLFLGPENVTGAQMQRLADAMDNVELPRQRLFLASPPLPHLPDRQAMEALVPFCQAGWMPLCFGAWGESADHVIDQDIYHPLDELSLLWGKTPEIYPVLSPLYSMQGMTLLPEDFIPWVEGIARHGVNFFSVYHAANTEKALWAMLEAVNIPCMETAERAPVVAAGVAPDSVTVAQPVYVTVGTSDTVWGIITRHGMSKQQFWEWNAHLWESRGLPRDPDYLQEGWRIRVK